MYRHSRMGVLALSTTCIAAWPASAQQTPSASTAQPAGDSTTQTDQLQDIVVTAQKRSTSLQRTPIAVTALDGETLQKAQVSDVQNVASLVPSFKAGETGGYAQITIRGIGIQNFAPLAESAAAVNLNEVYISRPVSFLTGLFDLKSIEVLRGPQGTLYGRNATAGSVNLNTVRPGNVLSGYANLTYGNYNELRAEAAIGGPVAGDTLLVRVAAFYERRDGYGRNITTGRDVDDKDAKAIRGTVVLNATADLKATFIAEHYREKDADAVYHFFGNAGTLPVSGTVGSPSLGVVLGGTVLANSRNVANDVQPLFDLKITTLTGILEWQHDRFSVRSIAGYRKQSALTLTDLDGSNLSLGLALAGENAHQFSQELQAHFDSTRLHLTIGGYYFNEVDSAEPFAVGLSTLGVDPAFGIPQRPALLVNFANLGGTIRTRSYAAFGEGTWEILDGLSITAGVRYSVDRKHLISTFGIDPFTPYSPTLPSPAGVDVPAKSFRSTTPKVSVQYQVTPRTLVYATYAKGFKSGSFDSTTSLSFEPEQLTDYEGGLKTTLLNNKLRANLAAFYYDYSNLQVQQTIGLGLVTANAGKARIYGFEGELNFLVTPDFELSLNAAYLNARYTQYVGADSARTLLPNVNFSGKTLNNSPSLSGTVFAQYTWHLGNDSIVLRGEGEYSSKFYFSPGNYDLVSQPDYAKANAFLTYNAAPGWSLTAFARNITDKTTRTSTVINTAVLLTPVQGSYAPPRTFGLLARYKF